MLYTDTIPKPLVPKRRENTGAEKIEIPRRSRLLKKFKRVILFLFFIVTPEFAKEIKMSQRPIW